MKKKSLSIGLVALLGVFALGSCNGTNRPAGDSTTNSSGGSSSGGGSSTTTDGFTGAASYVTNAEKRAEVLGQLEKYAMNTGISGIPILSDSSTTYYHNRIELPQGESGSLGYVEGYGTGLLREGRIKEDVAFSTENGYEAYKYYLHSYDTQTPSTGINALNGNDTRISGYYDYISSAFYGTRLVKEDGFNPSDPRYKSDFEWYPSLAKITSKNEEVDGKPLPVTNGQATSNYSGTDLYSTWRIYVKTGDDGLKYSVSKNSSNYGNTTYTRGVQIEDYIFAMKVLLNQKTGYYRSSSYTSGTGEIKGAASYYNATKNIGPIADSYSSKPTTSGYLSVSSEWANVGYQPGYDADTDSYYIDYTFNVPCDQFNAMYQISDSNIEPINPTFFGDKTYLDITTGGGLNGKTYTPLNYGKAEGSQGGNLINNILCLGPYVIDRWDDTHDVTYSRNSEWIECNETLDSNNAANYRIKGVMITIDTAAMNKTNYSQEQFTKDDGYLDSTSKPGSKSTFDEAKLKEKGYSIVNPGSSNWKLSVNACDATMWDKLFGPEGTVTRHDAGDTTSSQWSGVKYIMSNNDFIQGMYFAINREEAANLSGMAPAGEYFSDAYYIDPQNKIKYNDTEAHAKAMADYSPETYGYDEAIAKAYFEAAIQDELAAGHYSAGDTIKIETLWMSQANIEEFGDFICSCIENAFNDAAKAVDANNPVTLDVVAQVATNKGDVYTPITEGKFDLAFASLTGMNYNPLGMMEVMKSDNSSGFTLNWGTDTSANDGKSLVYDGKSWSFDALWNAAVYGVTAVDGVVTLPYIYNEKKSGFVQGEELADGSFASLSYQLTFDIDQDLQTAANMSIDSFQIATTFYGDHDGVITSYSFTVTLVSKLDESDPDKESKVVYTISEDNTTLTATLDVASLYYWSVVTKDSTGAIKPESEPSANEQKTVINDINDGSIGRTLALNAYYTVNMEFDGFASVATLNTSYIFKGASVQSN